VSGFDRLAIELDAGRFEGGTTEALIEQLGPPGRLLRALARARRRRWAGARIDALAVPEGDPIHDFVAGSVLFVARDYHHAMQRLGRAAASDRPVLAMQAGELAIRLAGELGWLDEQRSIWSQLGHGSRLPTEVQRRLVAARERRDRAKAGRAAALLELPDHEIEQAAQRAFARLAIDGADAALHSFAGLRERHGPAPALLVEQIRLELVLGRFDHADALLDERSAEPERFDGLRAALALARGEFEQAIVRTAHHRGDPWLLLIRGEALEQVGDLGEAATLLERARTQVPGSVAITLALALARHRGEADVLSEALEQRFAQLLERAPALISDAARILGVELWTDRGPIHASEGGGARETLAAILASARSLLTADRDPWTSSYRIPAGPLRLLVPAASEDHFARLHAGDADQAKIEQAERMLLPAPAHRPRSTSTSTMRGPAIHVAPWQPRALRPDEIERFLVDGYLIVRSCFDPRISEQWVRDANRRIREEPERWVKGYERSDTARDLADYDPERPETWTWPRINLEGPETVVVEQFAPRGWAAICDLLGGPERIKTRTWTNYLIANLAVDADLDVPGPAPDWPSWHIDDPSPVTRLDRITRGLIGIAIHSDLRPRSGGTWLALDSVGRVSRLLAAHPEGVDFCSGRGAGVTRECERFFEVTGEVGDLLLMHPLMMHSSSPNPSGRIRWMGNPMVYLEHPLQPLRDHASLSPVELAIHRAIRSRA
jgi:hypothetical protein